MPSKSFKRKNTKSKNKKAMKTKKNMKKRHSKRNTYGRKMRTNIRQMRGSAGDPYNNLISLGNNLKDKEITFTIQNENKINDIDKYNLKTITKETVIEGRVHDFEILNDYLKCSIVYNFKNNNGKKIMGQNYFTYCKNNICADGTKPDLSSLKLKKQLVNPAILNDNNNNNFFNNVNESMFEKPLNSTHYKNALYENE